MKTSIAVITECVGPRCISVLRRKSKRRSMSGITERTKISGTLKFTLRSLADALLNKYASAMCPTANEVCSSLEGKHLAGLLIRLFVDGVVCVRECWGVVGFLFIWFVYTFCLYGGCWVGVVFQGFWYDPFAVQKV